MTREKIDKICRKFFDLIIVLTLVLYIVPEAKRALFPDKMTRLEKMFRNATMERYEIAVEYQPSYSMILTVFDGGESITGRIFDRRLIELKPTQGNRVFLAHDVNTDAVRRAYLSRVYFKTDPELKHLLHLEMTMCSALKTPRAKIHFNDHEPIYDCEVPIQKITDFAAE